MLYNDSRISDSIWVSVTIIIVGSNLFTVCWLNDWPCILIATTREFNFSVMAIHYELFILSYWLFVFGNTDSINQKHGNHILFQIFLTHLSETHCLCTLHFHDFHCILDKSVFHWIFRHNPQISSIGNNVILLSKSKNW